VRLSPPLRISEIAALFGAGWSHRRTKLWILRAVEERGLEIEGGGETGRPITVSQAALRRCYPDIFEPPPGIEARVEAAEDRQREQEQQILQVATIVGTLRRRLKAAGSAAA
jgi:hypothetical protein